MQVQIEKTAYKDLEAIKIENNQLCAVFLPKYGGKMASLKHKKTGREFLVQADGAKYRKLLYAKSYVDAECSGFDDMFPTIDEWTYQKYPWQGAVMPDHGEVCGLPWEYEICSSGSCLQCRVHGVRFQYCLSKRITFAGESELLIEYEAVNLSPFDFDFLWAAHVMIRAEQDARILVPYDDGTAMTCVFSEDKTFAIPGDTLRWTKTKTQSSVPDIGRTQPMNPSGNTYKYYFNEPMPEGWCGYEYCDGTTLMLKVPKETVPYLGVWINNGSFKNYYNIALEPCTGAFDDPGKALAHGQSSILRAGENYTWQLRLSVIEKPS